MLDMEKGENLPWTDGVDSNLFLRKVQRISSCKTQQSFEKSVIYSTLTQKKDVKANHVLRYCKVEGLAC